MTAQRSSDPLDLMKVYMSPDIGIGQALKLETIDRRLEHIPLPMAVHLLAQITFHADECVGGRASSGELVANVFPAQFQRRA